jgi:hypothetical protein
MRVLIALICLLAATGCDEKSPTGPSVGFDQQVTLSPGDVSAVESTDVRLQFVAVTGDSRCPADAICIQGGDALARVRAYRGGDSAMFDLHTGDSSRAWATYGSVRFALVQLQPYPFSGRTIAQDDYRVTLEISRP